jgi:hypothetical protein
MRRTLNVCKAANLEGRQRSFRTPNFPLGQSARLLLQLDSEDVPFMINFGDGGIGYVFISSDSRKALFLWQGL